MAKLVKQYRALLWDLKTIAALNCFMIGATGLPILGLLLLGLFMYWQSHQDGALGLGLGLGLLLQFSVLLIYQAVSTVGLIKQKPFAIYMNLYAYALLLMGQLTGNLDFRPAFPLPVFFPQFLEVGMISQFAMRLFHYGIFRNIIIGISGGAILLIFTGRSFRNIYKINSVLLCAVVLNFAWSPSISGGNPCPDEIVDPWIRQLDDPAADRQLEALDHLKNCRINKVFNALLNRFKQKVTVDDLRDKDILLSYIRAFGLFENDSAVDPMRRLVHHHDAEIRRAVLQTLMEINKPEAITLIETFTSDPDPEIQQTAEKVTNLIQFRTKRNHEIDAIASKNIEKEVRSKMGLGHAPGDAEAAFPIPDIPEKKEDDPRMAIIELGNLRSLQAAEPLASYFQNDSEAIRDAALDAMRKCVTEEECNAFLRQIASSPELAMKSLTFRQWALHHLPKEQMAALMEKSILKLSDENPGVRRDAVQELWVYGSATVPYLNKALNDPDQDVASTAQSILGYIETPESKRILSDRMDVGRVKKLEVILLQQYFLPLLICLFLLIIRDPKPAGGAKIMSVLWFVSTVVLAISLVGPREPSAGILFISRSVLYLMIGMAIIWILAGIGLFIRHDHGRG